MIVKIVTNNLVISLTYTFDTPIVDIFESIFSTKEIIVFQPLTKSISFKKQILKKLN